MPSEESPSPDVRSSDAASWMSFRRAVILSVIVGVASFALGSILNDSGPLYRSDFAVALIFGGTLLVLGAFVVSGLLLIISSRARHSTSLLLAFAAAATFLLLVLPRMGK
jgi:hypothetical protein